MIVLTSRITSVTIFSDQAEVIRTTDLELELGEHHLIFDNLPQSILKDSIQVAAQGDVQLSNIKFEEASNQEASKNNHKIINDERQKIKDNIRSFEDKLNRLRKEKSFVENIADKLTAPSQESQTVLDAEKWMRMIDFYHEKLKKIDNQILESEKEITRWNEKLQLFEAEVKRISYQLDQTTYRVHLNVSLKKNTSIQLNISYLVNNAKWQPCYELRVSSVQKTMYVNYNACIYQDTTEDWENVKIILSTGKPGSSGEQPRLNPWPIQIFKPVYKSQQDKPYLENIPKVSAAPHNEERLYEENGFTSWQSKHHQITANDYFNARTASINFDIAGFHTIKSIPQEHYINIMVQSFVVDFQYSSVPKLSPYAYLKARVINKSEHPLLAGDTNIYLDNHFIANSRIKTIAPNEEFWTSLGLDKEIPIERKLLKKYRKNEAEKVDPRYEQTVYEYQIQIQNHKNTQQEIIIWDQLPIAENEEIKVNLLDPPYEEDTENLQKNQLEYLKWLLKVKPGEVSLIPFKFSIKYPKGENIIGLD